MRPAAARSLFDWLSLRARAVEARLRASALIDRRSLPGLLAALTPGVAARVVPLPIAEEAALASERLFSRLGLLPDTCLYRSLARYAVLRRAGHPARFCMGLDPKAAEILGHAWVEIDGEPVGETLEPGLTVTFAYPASGYDAPARGPTPSCPEGQ
jgi:hypothetical protein